MAKAGEQLWETRPLESWIKCKELRLQHYREVANARQDGKLIVSGSATWAGTLAAGLGKFVYFAGEPYGASISYDAQFAQECTEAAESRGLSRDLCSYIRNYWGSMYLDKYLFGGPFPVPDLYLTFHMCDSHAKWYQICSEYTGRPQFAIEWPVSPYGGWNRQNRIDYVAAQMWDAIEWMEKETGRTFDDEKLVQAIHYDTEGCSALAKAVALNEAIPAPMDHKSLLTLYVPAVCFKHSHEARDFYQLLLGEVQDRVENGIAALAMERYRVWHDNIPPWFFLRFYRILEQYGAICPGSLYLMQIIMGFKLNEERRWVPAKTPREMGLELRSREDALKFFAEWIIDSPGYDLFYGAETKTGHILQLMEQFHCQALALHLNRGCEAHACFQFEQRLSALDLGIPVLTYEGNMADKREFDESQVVDRMEAFMESLGLEKLDS